VNLYLDKITPAQWREISANAHRVSFGSNRDEDMDRINYALIIRNDSGLCSYATIVEPDRDSAYMQHGGAFPNIEKTIYSVRCYFMVTNYLKEHYKTISTRIVNTNTPMINLAHAAELLINGVDCVDGDIFLNLFWKRKA